MRRAWRSSPENGVEMKRSMKKREIMSVLPSGCSFIEPQDFRNDERELVYSCIGAAPAGH